MTNWTHKPDTGKQDAWWKRAPQARNTHSGSGWNVMVSLSKFLLRNFVGVLIGGLILYMAGYIVIHGVWQSYYATRYDVPVERVSIQPKPHDCEWGKAPLGEKYCHFERIVNHLEDKDGPYIIVSWQRVNE